MSFGNGLTILALGTVGLLIAACAAPGEAPSSLSTPILAALSRAVSEGGVTIERGESYGSLPRQRLDIYRPEQGEGDGPVAIFVYGGSWQSGDRSIYAFVGSALAARGITTVIPDYRLYPDVRFPAFVDDAALAYAWTARHVAAGCGRKRPIVVIGHSAGAHIGALLTLDRSYLERAGERLPRPSAFIGLAGPYEFDATTWPTTKEIFTTTARTPDLARPIAFVRRGAPPMLLIHGLADDVVEPKATRAFAAALHRAGVAVEKDEIEGLGHVGVVKAIAKPFRSEAPVLEDIVGYVYRTIPAPTARSVCNTTTTNG